MFRRIRNSSKSSFSSSLRNSWNVRRESCLSCSRIIRHSSVTRLNSWSSTLDLSFLSDLQVEYKISNCTKWAYPGRPTLRYHVCVIVTCCIMLFFVQAATRWKCMYQKGRGIFNFKVKETDNYGLIKTKKNDKKRDFGIHQSNWDYNPSSQNSNSKERLKLGIW